MKFKIMPESPSILDSTQIITSSPIKKRITPSPLKKSSFMLKSIGVISIDNEELTLLTISELHKAGVFNFVRFRMPTLQPNTPSFQRRISTIADKVLSRFLSGSRVPDQVPPTVSIKEMPLDQLIFGFAELEISIDAVLMIGKQIEVFNKFQGEKLPPIYVLTIGSPNDAAYETYGLAEVMNKTPFSLLRLARFGQSAHDEALMEMAVQTHAVSATHTKATLLATLPEFLIKAVEHLDTVDSNADISESLGGQRHFSYKYNISWLNTIAHVRSLFAAIADRLAHRFQWLMAYMSKPAPNQPINWDNLRPLLPPTDRFWADPFLVLRDGVTWLFFEEAPFISAKGNDIGHISVAQFGKNGFIGPVMRALDLPWHLSYPNVFEHEGEWYMIPESGAQNRVELYHCTHWPDQWEHHSVLLDNYAGYDASIILDKGVYWMFVARRPAGVATTDCLDLFCATSPLGPWRKHARSPVVLDVRTARPGGRPFVQPDGRLLRPVQDSSGGIYGRALRFQLITELNTHEYREHSINIIEPNSASGILGVHSYAATDELIVIDLCRKVSRLSLLRRLQTQLPEKLVSNTWSLECEPLL